jgi:drug/metabolite transporter (DMT)-like permease
MPPRDWLWLALLSILWGGSFFFVGAAVREVHPLFISSSRVVIAAAILAPLAYALGAAMPRTARAWLDFGVMATLNNAIPFSLIAYGQSHISGGLASVINATSPVFAAVLLAGGGHERLNAQRLSGLLAGVAGVAILTGGPAQLAASETAGILLCLGAAASYGLAGFWARSRLMHSKPLASAASQLICSSAIMSAIAAVHGGAMPAALPSAHSILALGGLGVLSTAAAYLVFFRVLSRSGPGNVLLVTMLIPVSAIAMGTAFLGERIQPHEIAGAIVIGLALLMIDGRLFRKARNTAGQGSMHTGGAGKTDG